MVAARAHLTARVERIPKAAVSVLLQSDTGFVAASAVLSDGMRPRVGLDLVQTTHVHDALRAFGERYLRRIFTDRERVHCCEGWSPAASAVPQRVTERLAARFAAKEAVFKLLQSPGGLGYRDVEVVDGRDVVLRGAALELANAGRFGPIAVSLTHEGDYAAACVTALEYT